MITPSQLSVAVATPVPPSLFGAVDAVHDTVVLAGQVITGATLSKTVMICEQVAVLLHASVAR